jgi:hypothetical protein
MSHSRIGTLAVASAALIGFVFSLQAQDVSGDDPSHSVARISLIQGEVNVQRGDSGEIVAAALNAPLLAQDHLQTADGSRAEIQFDSSNMVRLAGGTDLGLGNVAYRQYQLQLATGTIEYRVLRGQNAAVELDTPSISIRPQQSGEYRVTVTPDGTTTVTIRSGQAEIYSPQGTQTLSAGRTMLVRGSQSDPEFQMEAAIPRDQFDDWNHNRDQDLLRSRSYQYVATDVYGAEDLDPYGSWVPSTYGNVWAPRVAAGWAPYSAGRWVWEDYYGWTWVSYDPWGWAPYHYGRWFRNGSYGWCWWPGARAQRYYWRPALVAFFGFGGVNVGIGFGNVGWTALAPFEVWRPWYGRSAWGGYRNQVIVNNINIYNTYRNSRFNNGVVYTQFNRFGQGHGSFLSMNGAQIRNASLVRGRLPVTPTRSSLAFVNRTPGAMPQHFAAAQNQRFFSRQRTMPAQRTSFTDQQRRMADFQQRTLGTRPSFNAGNAGAQGRAAEFGRNAGARPDGNASANGGWRRAGADTNRPAQQAPNALRAPNANSNSYREGSASRGWQRFGQGNAANSERNVRPQVGSSPSQNWRNMDAARPNTAARPNAAQRPDVAQRPDASQRSSGSGWHRFGDPGSSSGFRDSSSRDSGGWHGFGSPQDRPDSAARPERNNRGGYTQPQYSRPSNNFRNEQPVRINPPMVQERPNYQPQRSYQAPRMSQPRYNAPRMSQPRYNAPRATEQRSAPRNESRGAVRGGGAPRGGGSHDGGGSRHPR